MQLKTVNIKPLYIVKLLGPRPKEFYFMHSLRITAIKDMVCSTWNIPYITLLNL